MKAIAKFPEVAHLYIGHCEVQYEAYIEDVDDPDFKPYFETKRAKLEHWWFGAAMTRKGLKPILRRIPENMDEVIQGFVNERTKCWPDVSPEMRDYQMRTHGYDVNTDHAHGQSRERKSTHWNVIALKVLWLTQNGYDCFGLIDSGQAIDAGAEEGGEA